MALTRHGKLSELLERTLWLFDFNTCSQSPRLGVARIELQLSAIRTEDISVDCQDKTVVNRPPQYAVVNFRFSLMTPQVPLSLH
jgi:hypothetical protein